MSRRSPRSVRRQMARQFPGYQELSRPLRPSSWLALKTGGTVMLFGLANWAGCHFWRWL